MSKYFSIQIRRRKETPEQKQKVREEILTKTKIFKKNDGEIEVLQPKRQADCEQNPHFPFQDSKLF